MKFIHNCIFTYFGRSNARFLVMLGLNWVRFRLHNYLELNSHWKLSRFQQTVPMVNVLLKEKGYFFYQFTWAYLNVISLFRTAYYLLRCNFRKREMNESTAQLFSSLIQLFKFNSHCRSPFSLSWLGNTERLRSFRCVCV